LGELNLNSSTIDINKPA